MRVFVCTLVPVRMHIRGSLVLWNLNVSTRLNVCVWVCACAYVHVRVCLFDVIFVHYVVAMESSLTPDAREDCVPIPFWPSESGC